MDIRRMSRQGMGTDSKEVSWVRSSWEVGIKTSRSSSGGLGFGDEVLDPRSSQILKNHGTLSRGSWEVELGFEFIIRNKNKTRITLKLI